MFPCTKKQGIVSMSMQSWKKEPEQPPISDWKIVGQL